MATLSNPRLRITVASSSNQADVEGTVDVALTTFEQFLIENAGLRLRLRCQLWGADHPDDDDHLYNFPNRQPVTKTDTYTFTARIPKSRIDEDDWPRPGDEVYAKFRLVSLEPSVPINVTANSPEVPGEF